MRADRTCLVTSRRCQLSGAMLLLALALAACNGRDARSNLHAEGVRELEAGRASAASALLGEALELAGTERSRKRTDLLHDRALAALHANELSIVDAAARELTTVTDRERAADGWLLLGAARARRADGARAQAEGPEAEPFAFDAAIALATEARAAFEAAVLVVGGRPSAARNAERMTVRIARWMLERDAAEPAAALVASDGTANVQLVPTDDGSGDDGAAPDEDPNGETPTQGPAQLAALDVDELERLITALARAERDKLEARAERRRARVADVEKDW